MEKGACFLKPIITDPWKNMKKMVCYLAIHEWLIVFGKCVCKYTILPWIRNGLRKPLQWDCVDVSMRTGNLLQFPENSWKIHDETCLNVFFLILLAHCITAQPIRKYHETSTASKFRAPRVWSDRRRKKNSPGAFRQKVGLNEEEAGFLAESFCGPV